MKSKFKIILWAVSIIAFLGVLGSVGSSKSAVQGVQVTLSPTISVSHFPTATLFPTATDIPTLAPTYTPVPTAVSNTSSSGLSNDTSYTNVYGNQVHSPAYSENGSVPAGASALCGDGTYSFSQSRRGTCSHHGGVAKWL